MLLCCLKDKLAGDFSAPVMCKNELVARRMYWNTIKGLQADSREYELYSVADFNPENGEVKSDFKLLPLTDSEDDLNE